MILGYPRLKEFGFQVDYTDDLSVREGGERIMCHSVGEKPTSNGETCDAS